MLGRDVAKDRVGVFALSRVREVQGTGGVFVRPVGFDAKQWFADAFGIKRSAEQMQVTLRFTPKVAAYIKERQWHASQELSTLPGGGVELRLVTSGRNELIRWILSWMPDVRVVGPASLRRRVLEKLREGMAANSDLAGSHWPVVWSK